MLCHMGREAMRKIVGRIEVFCSCERCRKRLFDLSPVAYECKLFKGLNAA